VQSAIVTVAMDDQELARTFEAALQHHRAGALTEAEARYRQVLGELPGHPDALQMLGILAQQTGRGAEAVELLSRAVGHDPRSAIRHYNLAKVLADNGRAADAIRHYRLAISWQPDFPAAWNNLGSLHNAADDVDAAIEAYRRCLNLKPDYAEARYNLGTALQKKGLWEESAAELQRALALRPNHADTYNNLGIALGELDRLDDAISTYRTGLAIQHEHEGLNSNLGAALRTAGQVRDSIIAFRRACARHADARAASNLLYALLLDPGSDEAAIREECRQWDRIYAEPLRRHRAPHENDRSPDRRLRIGYVSPDLGDHPVGRFMAPLLAHHDHQQFEIFVYCDHTRPDPIARQNRSHADAWRATDRMSDEQVARMVREDRIDILVDLVMHTSNNRLLVFARKPAPIQVSYLAYPGFTGLQTIDYRLTDPYLDPRVLTPLPPGGAGAEYSGLFEEPFQLPHTFWCYTEPVEACELAPPPVLKSDHITFGCLNNFGKVSELLIDAWFRILRQTPGSRLLVHARRGSHRDYLAARFQAEGIDPNRLEFVGFLKLPEYFRQYNQIDIALDTYPYAGGTTTCDALWMGVPVISLAGNLPISRGGASILSNVGLPELVAADVKEYVTIAHQSATDVPKLARLRSGMRQRMLASPLMNGPRFARDVETAYRQMWRRWCEFQ
jgi:predicted O-linked N-acetylglucosamine transferase (SPINDLY family)